MEDSPSEVNGTSLDWLLYVGRALKKGELPNTAGRDFLTTAIEKYIYAEGDITLDEALGLKSKPGAGKPSAQYARDMKLARPLLGMAFIRVHNRKLTVAQAAEEVIRRINEKKEVKDQSQLCQYQLKDLFHRLGGA